MSPELDDWVEKLGAALAAPDLPRNRKNEPGADKKWKVGDMVLQVPPHLLEPVADRLGVPLGKLHSYGETSRVYPPHERTVAASWTAYRELRKLPKEERMARLQPGMTMRQAAVAAGKKAFDQRADHRQPPEQRAQRIIQQLQDETVRELVLGAVDKSKEARRARRAAKAAADEHTVVRKLIEHEVRRAQSTPGPDLAYWKTRKELNDAEQYVHSIASLYEEHREAMPEHRWPELAEVLKALADSAEEIAEQVEGRGTRTQIIDVDPIDDDDDVPALGSGDVVDVEVVDAEVVNG